MKLKTDITNEILEAKWQHNMLTVLTGSPLYVLIGVMVMLVGHWNQGIFWSYLFCFLCYCYFIFLGFTLRDPELRVHLPQELCFYVAILHQTLILHWTHLDLVHVLGANLIFSASLIVLGMLSKRNVKIQTAINVLALFSLLTVQTDFPKYAFVLGYMPLILWAYLGSAQRAQMMSDLAHSKRRLEQAQSHSKMTIWSWNPELDSFNYDKFFAQVMRRDPEALPKKSDDFLNLLEDSSVVEMKKRLFSPSEVLLDNGYDLTLRDQSGDAIYLHGKSQLISNDGANEVVGLMWDVTEQVHGKKMIEEQRMRSTTSARLASLGEMAGGVAHEINSPLAIIQMLSGQMREMIEDGSAQWGDVIKGLEKIEKTTIRIAKIIIGMKTVSRDGSQDPFVPTPLKTIVDDTLALCAAKFASHQISLKTSEVTPQLEIKCRATQITQVLLNLLNNALDAVELKTDARVEIELTPQENGVTLAVIDNGGGISKETQEKLFQPFFTTKPVGKGTGLGLSISRGIVEDHGGTITLDDSQGLTRFIVFLPFRVEAAQSKT